MDENKSDVVKSAERREMKNGITEYIIRLKKPVYLNSKDLNKLVLDKQIKVLGAFPKVFIGVPLIVNKKTIGIIAIQDYKSENNLQKSDLQILNFIVKKDVRKILANLCVPMTIGILANLCVIVLKSCFAEVRKVDARFRKEQNAKIPHV